MISPFDLSPQSFGLDAANRKFAPYFGEVSADSDTAAWAEVTNLIEDFERADKVVPSYPMWNYIRRARKLYLEILPALLDIRP